ncbi:phosphotransferase enzyme family protein [Deinococcus frigens]|uniref:phosphotransferase enzyme family protein n=1 Tax=Deinococcus frigens TaxID=249403 RepID=UPI0004963EA1|nr:phosphotransferase [Deinococcus frigens]
MKEEVARQWDVGRVWSITPLGGGSINGAFRVKAGAGSFHLRVYRDAQRQTIEREHAAIAVALAGSVSTPRPVPLRACGTGGIGQLGSAWAALFERAPGAVIAREALTEADVRHMGGFLADLHTRLPQKVNFEAPRVGSSGRTRERLERVEQAIVNLPRPDETDGWALERTRQRLALLRTSPQAPFVSAAPFRFLHGDFHGGNVFFVDGQPASIIDWEQTRLAPRAWEVVRFLDYSLRLRPDLSRAFLAGYRQILPLGAAELLDGVHLYAHLQESNVWVFESVYTDNNPGPKVFIRPPPYVPFARAWREADLH